MAQNQRQCGGDSGLIVDDENPLGWLRLGDLLVPFRCSVKAILKPLPSVIFRCGGEEQTANVGQVSNAHW
jgi:hypothetical protein